MGAILRLGLGIWLASLPLAAFYAIAQVVVGVLNVLWRLPVEITALHSALAAALVCTIGVGLRESWRGA